MKYFGVILLLLVSQGLGIPDDYDYEYGDNEHVEDNQQEVAVRTPPAFNVEPEVFKPVEEDTVSIPCTSDDKTSDFVLIIEKHSMDKVDTKIIIVAGDVYFVKDPRYLLQNNVFTISNVKRSDRGKYECFYQYQNNRINVTHTLDVQFEPTIKRKQKTLDVNKGESATLECRSSGNPTPTITWSKQEGEMPSGAQEEQGTSITFENIDRHISGSYVCTAENGVGNPSSATRDIIVSYPPEIRTENEIIRSGDGGRVELVCIVHAHPAAEIQWVHDGRPVDLDSRAEVLHGGHRHLLTIEAVSNSDFGSYRCIANNALGSDEKEIHLTDAPSAPSITSDPHSAEENSYTLTWTTDSYYPIAQYKLMYRRSKANDSTDQPGEWQEVKEEPEDVQTGIARTFRHTLTDLERATDYDAVLSVSNRVKPAEEEVSFTFSTRKETADHRSTSGSDGVLMSSIIFITSLCFIKLHY